MAKQKTQKKYQRKHKKYNYIKIGIMVINLIMSLLLIINIGKLDMIPIKYFLLGILVFIIINALIAILLLLRKWVFRIIGIILSILLVAICGIGIVYIDETNDFLSSSFNNNTVEISSYNVVVLKDSRYEEVSDLKKKKVSYLTGEDKSLAKFNEAVDATTIEYMDIFVMYDELINKKVQAILIDQAYMDVLRDEHEDLDSKVKVLYTFDLETIIEKKEEPEEILRPITIYISGSDSRANTISNKSRSDVNMLMTINPYTNEILLTSVPRDYYVQVHGQTGLKDKLTHAGIYGLDRSAKTMGDLFGIEVDYSVKVGFNAVEEVVDLVGGIEVYSDITFNSYHKPGWVVQKGMNQMDGKKALAYARERYAYASGDRHRIQNQQQVLEAVLKKALTNKSLLLKYDQLLASLGNLYRTDIPKEVITEFVKDQLNSMDKWTFEKQWVDGKGASLPTYTAPQFKRYVMIPNEEDVKKASEKIKQVLENE